MSEKQLVVTAKYNTLEFKGSAYPYNPKVHQEQYDTCLSEIHEKMKKEGRYEMKGSFKYLEKIEEKPER